MTKNAANLTKELKRIMGDKFKGYKVKISETKTRRLLKNYVGTSW